MPLTPTTTLTEQTSNNTSAADSFSITSNGNIVPRNISKLPTKQLLGDWFTGKLLVHMMGWWTKSGHVAGVGYSSDDPTQVQRQLDDMISRGFDGMTLAWYGEGDLSDSTFIQWAAKAPTASFPFTIAIRLNEEILSNASFGSTAEERVTTELEYVANHYFGNSAYMKMSFGGIDNRPVVFFFLSQSEYTDVNNTDGLGWSRIKSAITSLGWPSPLFIIKDKHGYGYNSDQPQMNGAMSWGVADGTDAYYNDFYGTYDDNPDFYTNHLMFADVNKGMNDSVASWGTGRIVDQKAGNRWLDTFSKIRSYFDPSLNPSAVPFTGVGAITWNDYEEGTGIECGIDNTASVSAAIDASGLLTFSLSFSSPDGSEATIDHYKVWASTDGENLAQLGSNITTVSAKQLNLASLGLDPGSYLIYVQAIGQPSITNAMSSPVVFSVGTNGGGSDSSPGTTIMTPTSSSITLGARWRPPSFYQLMNQIVQAQSSDKSPAQVAQSMQNFGQQLDQAIKIAFENIYLLEDALNVNVDALSGDNANVTSDLSDIAADYLGIKPTAASKKMAFGSTTVTGSASSVATNLDAVDQVVGVIDSGGLGLNEWLSITPSGTAGAIDIHVWKPTSNADNTPVSSVTPRVVRWFAKGT